MPIRKPWSSCGMNPVGTLLIDPDGCAEADEEHKQQHIAQLERDVNDAGVGPRQPGDERICAMNEGGEGARHGSDVEEVKLMWARFFSAQEAWRRAPAKA